MNHVINGICLVLAISIWSCSESTIIGNNLVGEEDFQVSYIDTLSVSLATFQYDSLVTGNQSRLLVGARTHTLIGDVSASAVLSIAQSEFPSIGSRHRFDSLVLSLPLDGHLRIPNDVKTVTVHADQLATALEWGDDGQLYNTSKAPDAIVYSATDVIRLERERELTVSLRFDEPGQRLFNAYQESGSLDHDDFEALMGAFRVYVESEQDVVFGLSREAVAMKLYYTDMQQLPVQQQEANFQIAVNYSQIQNVKVPEAFQLSGSDALVNSTHTANQSLLAGGAGYGIRATFPGLKALMLAGDDYLVAAANLQLKPFFDELMEPADYPAYLEVDIYEVGSETLLTTEPLRAVLQLDADFGRDTYYQMDVTDLVEYMLVPFSTDNYGLRIQLPEEAMRTSADVVAIGDSENGSQLILYTLAID